MALRKYQQETLDAVVTSFDAGVNRQLAALATGTGKTVIFSNLPSVLETKLPGQMWVLAHREELIDQAVAKIRQWNPSLIVDKEMAEHYANPFADVIVASVATIGRKGIKRAERFDWDNVTKVVIDEAHHAPAQTYLNFLEMTGVMKDPKKLLLGVTATPKRGDGKALAEVFQKIIYEYPIRKAIEDGWLVDLRPWRVRTATSLDDVSTTAGDFQTDQLSNAVNTPARNQLVVKGWMEKAEGRQTVVFTVDIQHAIDLAAMFRQNGIKAAAIWGDDPDREDKLRAHKAGEITVLLNCGILTEGYDDWRIGCVVLARPTKSGSLYTQMVGRGTRLQDGTGNLLEAIAAGQTLEKTDCILIDVTDTTRRHKLQSAATLLGLEDIDLNGKLAVKAVQELERAQEQNPNIDFSNLKDITQLKTYIESVNLWEDRSVPEEIASSSKLDWHKRTDGSYMLMLKSEEDGYFFRKGNKIPIYKQKTVYVQENHLGKFEIISVARRTASPTQAASTTVQSKAEAATLADALRAVERAVVASGQGAYLSRVERAGDARPASDPQRKAVRGYYKRQLRDIPFCLCETRPTTPVCTVCMKNNALTSAQASNLISRAQAKRRA